MRRNTRKVTSDKFTITLPQDWREILFIQQGDEIVPYYSSGSPLVIVPKNRPLSEFEEELVDMLTEGPTPERAKMLIDRLEVAKRFLESTILATKEA